MKAPLALAIIATLAACANGSSGSGSSSGVPKPVPTVSASAFDTFASFDTAHRALEAEKQKQLHTAFTNGVTFPDTGTASFSGTYQSILDSAGSPTKLVGLANVTADYAAGTISGGADSFVGQQASGATGFYSGSVAFSNGEIGKDPAIAGSTQNDFRFDYAGTLTGNGQTVVLSGSNDMGKFLKTPITGIEATGTSTATVDGATVTDEMSLYADID